MDHTTICGVCDGTGHGAGGRICSWCGGCGHKMTTIRPTPMPASETSQKAMKLVLYAIQNEEGQWYRTYGSNRSRGWVRDLSNARIYSKLGTAKGKLTSLANEHPELPVPKLVEFIINEVRILDQVDRVEKSRREKQIRAEALKELRVAYELQRAQQSLNDAQVNLDRLRRK